MVTRHSDTTIDVKRDVVMFHTVLVIDDTKRPIAVAITTNPLEHRAYAQVVMHKSRSHGCSVQVARYVRRTFGIEAPVTTHRATRPVEAMIGWACHAGKQYPPQADTPWHPTVLHIAATPIATLLEEVAGGHNAARTRYVVYEVRSASHPPHRGITNRYDAVERRYREAPPDTLVDSTVVHVGRFATHEEADMQTVGFLRAGDWLWTRHPSADYVRRILHIDRSPQPPSRHGVHDILWSCDNTPAVRQYETMNVVCIGPQVHTEFVVRHILEHGEWVDGRSHEGRRIKVMGGP